MANGDDALAAGMDILTGNEDRRNGWDEDNKTRDYIARRTSIVTPLEKGGTGATTAAGARNALGVPATGDVALRNGLGFVYGVAQLSAHNIGFYRNDGANRTVVRVSSGAGQFDEAIVTEGTLPGLMGDTVKTSGGTITGSLYLPNSSPAIAGYAVAYINNDGRVSRGASSERYKKYISAIDPASLGDIFPDLHRFQMRQGEPGAWKYGWIAERLAENPDTEPFVVYNEQGAPETIDFIALLIAQNAQHHQAMDLMAQRIAALEARHAES
ncbi:hypothetical protein [Microbacterium maritypicum]|uniref:hypothetical protein n=1 Tax=Microbacterium maritypicum TaxID=33918 RepID=UPI0037FF69B8